MEKEPEEASRFVYARNQLKNVLLRFLPDEGVFVTAIPGVGMARRDHAGMTEHRFDKPLASLLVQGSKITAIGDSEHQMTAGDILTVGLDMPSFSTILEATSERPLLTFFFELNRQMISELICELDDQSVVAAHSCGVSVEKADADLWRPC